MKHIYLIWMKLTCFGSNRKQTHIQAPKGSGGVGLLIKCDLYNSYNVKVIDHAYEGIIGVHFANKFSDFNFIVYSLYLPPENSPWGRDATAFFSHLLTQVYLHCETDALILCGDLNSRIGSIQENNDCFDNIPHRTLVDKACNQHGKSFLEFLNDSRCCILNGRFGKESEEYTFYSTRSFGCRLHLSTSRQLYTVSEFSNHKMHWSCRKIQPLPPFGRKE